MTAKYSAWIFADLVQIKPNNILSDDILGGAHVFTAILLFYVCNVDMADYIIMDCYILAD